MSQIPWCLPFCASLPRRVPMPPGHRACPLQRAPSSVTRPPFRLSRHSSIARISPMIVCAVWRLFRLIVELRLPQRIEQRLRHGLASRRCSVAATLDSHHAARKSQRPISTNDPPVRATSSSLFRKNIYLELLYSFLSGFGFFLPRLLVFYVVTLYWIVTFLSFIGRIRVRFDL